MRLRAEVYLRHSISPDLQIQKRKSYLPIS